MPDEQMGVELDHGAVVIQDTALWGWDNDKSVCLATGSPEKRRIQFVTDDGVVITLGLMSLTIETKMVQTDAGLFAPVGNVMYPVADKMVTTLIGARGQEVPGIQPKSNYRRSNR